MYTNILLPTDGSPLAAQGVSHGLKLAKALGASVTAVVVTEPFFAMNPSEELRAVLSASVDEINAAAATAATARLKEVEDQAAPLRIPCMPIHVFDRWPADGILEVAKDRACDLIVMSSHSRRGLGRALLGSQAFEVLARGNVPVLIVPVRDKPNLQSTSAPTPAAIYSNILIASDGSAAGQKAVDQGLALAKQLRASVTFIVASGTASALGLEGMPEVSLWASMNQIAKATANAADMILQRCAERAAALGVVHELVHARDKVASDALLETATKHRCDLIVMGSHGYRGVERLLLGSQTYSVVGRTALPILIVK